MKFENQPPIACDFNAMNVEQRNRYNAVSQHLRASVKEVRELPDGYALQLPTEPSVILMAAEFMTLERLCCPFLTLALEIESQGGPTWLQLTGREGVKEFLQAELGLG